MRYNHFNTENTEILHLAHRFVQIAIIAHLFVSTTFPNNDIMASISSLQTPHGYPEFVSLDSKYTCVICQRVLREAVQTTCGHRTCEDCLLTYFEGKEEPVPCPAHEDDCDPQHKNDITPDRSVRREIRNLPVYCTFRAHGCTEVLQWKELENHASKCDYRLVECSNKELGCTQLIPLAKKEEHATKECRFRLVNCRYCNAPVSLSKQEEHEMLECNNAPLKCRYGCEDNFSSRDEMNRHLEICPVKPVECKFKVIGCTFLGNENDMRDHEKNALNSHLEMITVYTANLDVGNLTLRRQFQEVTNERNALKQEVSRLTAELHSAQTDINILKAHMEKHNKESKELKLKMVSMTERIIHLERKSEDMAKKELVDKHDQDLRALQSSMTQVRTSVSNIDRQGASRGASGGGSDPDATRRLDNHDTQLAQVDVQMAELDLRFQIMETASYNGHLLWKLRDYNRRKADAVSGKTLSLYSQPFYTHRFGYKMCARVYLNGDGMGKGSHLSLFFVVMRGEYDNLLPWPFQQKVTMILLDQEVGQIHLSDTFRPEPSSSSFRKPTTEMNIASGCPLFVSHAVLETPKYIKEDTLFIKFIVDTSNLSHP